MARIPHFDMPGYIAFGLRSLRRFGVLSPEEDRSIRDHVREAEAYPADAELIAEGAKMRHPSLLLSGWAARLRVLKNGRRQIFGFLVPGDLFGICHRAEPVALCATVGLTKSVVAPMNIVTHAFQRERKGTDTLTRAAWNAISLDEASMFNQVVRVGSQSAYERTAHLLLELFHRLRSIGLADEASFSLPLSQNVLSDALGLSVVHTNRTLQQLRRDHLIETEHQTIRLLKLPAMERLSDCRFFPRNR